MKRYWHIYTKGLEDDLIFRCEEDFVVGMNNVPVALHGKDIVILAFVLMTNHFHLSCVREKMWRGSLLRRIRIWSVDMYM